MGTLTKPIQDSIAELWTNEVVDFQPGLVMPGAVYIQHVTKKMVVDDDLAHDIRARLLALGGNVNEVADSLRKLEIKGYQGNPLECAIAKFLHLVLDGMAEQISVGPYAVHVHTRDGRSAMVLTTPAIQQFIRMFDAGKYPDLCSNRRLYIPPVFPKEAEIPHAVFSSEVQLTVSNL